MINRLVAVCAIALPLGFQGIGSEAFAQERVTLGWGRLLTNDALGDGEDRWRTGSYVVSRVRGPSWTGALPAMPGEILEFRLRFETIAPADLIVANPNDRRYVGALTLGMHTHFDWVGMETSAGLDAVIVGPQNKISSLHGDLHDLLGLPAPTVFGSQISDAVYLTAVGEVGKTFSFGSVAQVRPYVEAQAGAETLIRVGGDITLGGYARDALMLRDSATGQRYRGVTGDRVEGMSLTLGGDIARVFDSEYFLAGDVATLADTRSRLRAGVHWQGAQSEAFYGLTWLGKEFDQQVDDQLVGSINLRLQF